MESKPSVSIFNVILSEMTADRQKTQKYPTPACICKKLKKFSIFGRMKNLCILNRKTWNNVSVIWNFIFNQIVKNWWFSSCNRGFFSSQYTLSLSLTFRIPPVWFLILPHDLEAGFPWENLVWIPHYSSTN